MIYHSHLWVKATSVPALSEIARAWAFSRPNDQQPLMINLVATDVPVHEFARFSVQMSVPILLREWLVSFRDHIIWARTSRVDDLSNWPIYWKVEPMDVMGHMDRMIGDQAKDQDHFRRHLPLAYMTQLSAALSFRSWIKIVKAAYAMATVTEGAVSSMFCEFAEVLGDCFESSGELQRLRDEALLSFGLEQPLAKGISITEDTGTSVNGFFVGAIASVSLSLRAQMLRHRPLVVRDNLWELLQLPDILLHTIDTPMQVSFACSDEVAQRLAVKRNCWIAQEDLWAPVIRLINKAGDAPALPCDYGPCIAVRDNTLRKEGKDPAPPCARYAKIAGEKFTPAQTARAKEYLPLRPLTTEFWDKEITDVSL